MKIKVWEITNGVRKWYELYDRPNDYLYGIYNNGYEEVELPNDFKLEMPQCEIPQLYIYKNSYAYYIHKVRTRYALYPASLSLYEAYLHNKFIYI